MSALPSAHTSCHPAHWPRAAAVALLLLLLPLMPRQAAAQATGMLEMLVVSGDTRVPLAGVRVQLTPSALGGLTDPTGHLLLRGVPVGRQRVSISRIGYRTENLEVLIGAGETMRLQVPLAVDAVALEGVEITARSEPPAVPRLNRAGYYDRKRLNPGTFFGPEEMEHRRVLGGRLSDLLRGATGLYLEPMLGGGYAAFSTRGRGVTVAPCPLAVFVDGMRQMPDRNPPASASEAINRMNPDLAQVDTDRLPTNVDRLLALMDIEAIEVYSGRATPLQFQVPPVCGAIVIWTRSSGR